jgi:type II secretory pathway component PulC
MAIKSFCNVIEFSALLVSLTACHGDASKAVRGKDNVATATLPPQITVSTSATPSTPAAALVTSIAPHVASPVQIQTPVPKSFDFRLVGIITGSDSRMAMLEDVAGLGYTVKIGSRVGRTNNIVKSIGMDDIILSSSGTLERIQLGN